MRLNVEISEALYREVVEQAQADGRSLSDVVRGLLRDWLEVRWAQRRAREADRCVKRVERGKEALLG